MKKYSTPEVEMIELEIVDAVATSGGLNQSGEGTFDDVIEWT